VKHKPVFMTQKYPIAEPQGCYLLTLNTIDRVDIFIRPFFKQIIVESLNYFIEKKGLVVYGWCLMTNHLHLIVQPKDGFDLSALIKDFKGLHRKDHPRRPQYGIRHQTLMDNEKNQGSSLI
jgi:REP element-mobilizing transposase RayT